MEEAGAPRAGDPEPTPFTSELRSHRNPSRATLSRAKSHGLGASALGIQCPSRFLLLVHLNVSWFPWDRGWLLPSLHVFCQNLLSSSRFLCCFPHGPAFASPRGAGKPEPPASLGAASSSPHGVVITGLCDVPHPWWEEKVLVPPCASCPVAPGACTRPGDSRQRHSPLGSPARIPHGSYYSEFVSQGCILSCFNGVDVFACF